VINAAVFDQLVGLEVAHRVTSMLTTVRYPNRACRLPSDGFHERYPVALD
jgi:hypothetical protein